MASCGCCCCCRGRSRSIWTCVSGTCRRACDSSYADRSGTPRSRRWAAAHLLFHRKVGIPRHRHPRRHPREDRREDFGVSGDFPVRLATGITSGNRSRVSDVSARILARMSVSVWASWNASLKRRSHWTRRIGLVLSPRTRCEALRWVCRSVCLSTPLAYLVNRSAELRQIFVHVACCVARLGGMLNDWPKMPTEVSRCRKRFQTILSSFGRCSKSLANFSHACFSEEVFSIS